MIDEKEIAIVTKMTKVEYDMKRLKLSYGQLIAFYKREGVNWQRITESNDRQMAGLEKLKKIFPNARIIKREELSKEKLKDFKLIISYGGDNHFQYVTHFVDDQLILGMNSDPKRSEGALTCVSVDYLDDRDNILNEDFKMEDWTRLEVSINGKIVDELAASDIFIGEKVRYQMSRLLIKYKDKNYEQKGSGIVIATGAGSTGWYRSASRYIKSNNETVSNQDKKFVFIFTEPYSWKLTKMDLTQGEVGESETLEVTSLCDFQAIVAIDALKVVEISEGSKIKVSIGKPLRVVRLKVNFNNNCIVVTKSKDLKSGVNQASYEKKLE